MHCAVQTEWGWLWKISIFSRCSRSIAQTNRCLFVYFSTVLFRWPGNERTYKTLKSLMPHRVKRHVLLKLGLSYVPRTHCIYDFKKGSVAVGQVTRIPLGFRGFNVVIRCSIKAYLLPQVASIAPAQQYTYYPLL